MKKKSKFHNYCFAGMYDIYMYTYYYVISYALAYIGNNIKNSSIVRCHCWSVDWSGVVGTQFLFIYFFLTLFSSRPPMTDLVYDTRTTTSYKKYNMNSIKYIYSVYCIRSRDEYDGREKKAPHLTL